jgi:hypothetical protein
MKYFLLVVFLLSSCSREIKDNNLKLGTGTANDVVIEANIGNVANPKLIFDSGTNAWKFSNNGTTFSEVGPIGYELISSQRLTTVGTTTYTVPAGTTFLKFVYCHGGGGGNGAPTTGAGQMSGGLIPGGASAGVCNLHNPPSSINITVPAGNSGCSFSPALCPRFGPGPTIPGCGTIFGTGDYFPDSATRAVNFILPRTWYNEAVWDSGPVPPTSLQAYYGDTPGLFLGIGEVVADGAVCYTSNGTVASCQGSSGSRLIFPPELAYRGSLPSAPNANGANGNPCGGGGAALNLASQGTARTGGAGGRGEVVVYAFKKK